MTPYDAPPRIAIPPAVLMTDDALLAAVEARGENTGKPSSNKTMLITATLFLVFGGLSWGWNWVLLLTAAVAVHEIGHVIAMRIFGYKNVRLLFLPLFGGLATGEPRELDATKNAIVSLAGPAFGVAIAILAAVIALSLESSAWLVEFAWVSLFLNAFNLLPLVPLDGGQFTNDALFSRLPILELVFRLLAIVGLAWITVTLEFWLLGIVVFFMLISTPVAYRRARLIRDARRDPLWQSRVLDRDTVVLLRELVTGVFKGIDRSKYESKLPEHVHGVWLEIRKRFPGVGTTVALLGAYAFLCMIVLPAVAFFFGRFLPQPVF